LKESAHCMHIAISFLKYHIRQCIQRVIFCIAI